MSSKLATKIFEVYVSTDTGFAQKMLKELGPSGVQAQNRAANDGQRKDPSQKASEEMRRKAQANQSKAKTAANKTKTEFKQIDKASKDKPVT